MNIIAATAGPITGFIVQPLVGIFSDVTEHYFGRRRPYIMVGHLFAAIGLFLVAMCTIIGRLLGDDANGDSPYQHKAAIALAVIGLWVLNVFVNVIQGPARALVNDLVDPAKTQLANAIVTGAMSIAAVAVNLLGALFVSQTDPYFAIFFIGVGFTLVSMFPTVIYGSEKQHRRRFDDPPPTIQRIFLSVVQAIRSMPSALVKVFVVFALSWMAWTPLMVNQTTFFIKDVYHNESYGLYMGFYSLALQSTVQASFSLLMPYLIELIGMKLTYFFTQLVAAICLFLIWFLPFIGIEHSLASALTLTAVPAINCAAFSSIPYALTTDIVGEEKNLGLFLGLLSSVAVFAQTVVLLGVSFPILRYYDTTYAIGTGFLFSLVTCVLIFLLDDNFEKPAVSNIQDDAHRSLLA